MNGVIAGVPITPNFSTSIQYLSAMPYVDPTLFMSALDGRWQTRQQEILRLFDQLQEQIVALMAYVVRDTLQCLRHHGVRDESALLRLKHMIVTLDSLRFFRHEQVETDLLALMALGGSGEETAQQGTQETDLLDIGDCLRLSLLDAMGGDERRARVL